MSPEHRELYTAHLAGQRALLRRLQQRTAPASGVATAVERALTRRRPRPRILVGADSAVLVAMKTLLPTRGMDALWTRGLGLHQQPPPTAPVIREEPSAHGSGASDAIRRVEVGPAAMTTVPRPADGRPAQLGDRPAAS